MPKATIDNVAALAGVSIKTVSRVLNREPNVREVTRDKVLAAARKLDYRPNPSARGLAGRRSFLVGLLYDNPSDSYVMNTQIGCLESLQDRGYGLVLSACDSRSPQLVAQTLALVARSSLDGLVLTPPLSDDQALFEALCEHGIATVRIAPRDLSSGLVVSLDDRSAARDVVEYLLQQGHRRIAIVRGPREHGASCWRYDGYCDALREAGIDVDPTLRFDGGFTYQSGVDAANFLFSLPQPPSAIFACDDDMAAGILHRALDLGIRVPEQVSVVGFDNARHAAQLWPALTTVHQPVREMGQRAVTLLVDAIEGGPQRVLHRVDYELVLRDSVCPYCEGVRT